MQKPYPKISVIIPTLNEEKSLPKCLKSVVSQTYPREKIELLIIDDGSTDNTVPLAKKFGARIIYNGSHHIERGKSIGLANAKGELIFFIDADNRLTSNKWFKDAVEIFRNHKEVVGIESWKYKYSKKDSLINRYCALFGVNDPLGFYLGKAGFLMATQNHWRDKKTLVEEFKGYFLTRFSTKNLALIGSNGYMTKRKLLLKTDWKPYLFHLDSAYDLVSQGYNTFARLKYEVEHDFANSFKEMIQKNKRNTDLFLIYQDKRRFKYDSSLFLKIWIFLIMISFLIPLKDSFLGFIKRKDYAWFLHPLICFSVILVDIYSLFEFYLFKQFRRLKNK